MRYQATPGVPETKHNPEVAVQIATPSPGTLPTRGHGVTPLGLPGGESIFEPTMHSRVDNAAKKRNAWRSNLVRSATPRPLLLFFFPHHRAAEAECLDVQPTAETAKKALSSLRRLLAGAEERSNRHDGRNSVHEFLSRAHSSGNATRDTKRNDNKVDKNEVSSL